MDIQLKDDGKKGQFIIETDGNVVAEMTYVWAGPDKIIIDHTLVDKSLQGKNVGKQLVHRAVLLQGKNKLKYYLFVLLHQPFLQKHQNIKTF